MRAQIRGGQSLSVWLFLLFYSAILISFSRYTFNLDDIWMWLDIFNNKPISNGLSALSRGRFWPLGLFELNILRNISNSPYLYFATNALLAIIFALLFNKILRLTNPFRFNFIFIALFMLHVGFVTVFFGICYPEKMLLVSLSAFILCSFLLFKNPRAKFFVFGIIALNISIYLKEPIFLSALVFGAILIIFGRDIIRLYGAFICASSAIFGAIYIYFVLPQIDKTYSRLTPSADSLMIKLRGFINFALNDGFIVFTLCALLIYRAMLILKKKDKFHIFYDGLLLSAFVYFLSYLILGIFETYYLLPCYVFGGASMIYFLRTSYKRLKIFIALGAFGFFLSAFPSGIYQMVNLKSMGVQFHQTMQFVRDYVAQNGRTNIYFHGIARTGSNWYAGYFIKYLNELYDTYDFDVLVNMPNGIDITLKNSRYTLENSLDLSEPKHGDLVIINNQSLLAFSESCELVFKSSLATIPYINIKSILKLASLKRKNSFHKNDAGLIDENPMRLPLQTYICRI